MKKVIALEAAAASNAALAARAPAGSLRRLFWGWAAEEADRRAKQAFAAALRGGRPRWVAPLPVKDVDR